MIFLMYHELALPGRELCQKAAGYARYVLPLDEFRSQVSFIRGQGFRVFNVGDGLSSTTTDRSLVLTFDDGCETDYLAAGPLLKEAGFGATFYAVAGFIGHQGYMSASQLRELWRMGFEIGCHSMTHPYLTDLNDDDLQMEVVGAKSKLEDLLGQPIHHFSCPGGRWNRRVVASVRAAGYLSLATSKAVENHKDSDVFMLGRVAVQRAMQPEQFGRLCEGKTLLKLRGREAVLSASKTILGNSLYEKLRSTLLGDS